MTRRPVIPQPQPLKKAVRRPHWTARATKSARAHPWLTWGTAASIAAVLGAIPIVAQYLPQFQSAEAASAHEKQDAREFAALQYGQQQIVTLLLRNRVNDCNAKVKTADRHGANSSSLSR